MEAVTGQYVNGSFRSALSCAIVTVLPGSSQNLLGHIVMWQGEAFIDAVIHDSVCRRRVFARLRQSNELPAVHQVVHCCVVCINVDSVLRLTVIRAPWNELVDGELSSRFDIIGALDNVVLPTNRASNSFSRNSGFSRPQF